MYYLESLYKVLQKPNYYEGKLLNKITKNSIMQKSFLNIHNL